MTLSSKEHLPTYYSSFPEADPELIVAWGLCSCGWVSGSFAYSHVKHVSKGWENHIRREEFRANNIPLFRDH